MPLLRKKPFVPLHPPPDLRASEEVFLNKLTKEIFRDYEEYFKRSILCNSLVWSCEYTGRCNLTLCEAMQSEADASEQLEKIPAPLQQAICYTLYKTEVSSLSTFVEDVFLFYRARYLIGETVDINPDSKGTSSRVDAVISDIELPSDEGWVWPDKVMYKCTVGSECYIIPGEHVWRKKNKMTKERVKLLVKVAAKRLTTDPQTYSVKPEQIERLDLNSSEIKIPYLKHYGLTPPNKPLPQKRKSMLDDSACNGDDEDNPTPNKKKKKKVPTKTKEYKPPAPSVPKISAEERRRQVEEERNRRKKERQEERDLQRKVKDVELLFNREWMRPREDLELTDSKELPLITAPVQSSLPLNLFGDVVMVTEFFYLFGEHVDLREEFPDGVQIGLLEQSLVTNKHEGLFGELVMFLLKLLFALQEEEEEEEINFSQKYSFPYTVPSLNTKLVPMIPSVSWQTVMEAPKGVDSDGNPLNYTGAAQAQFFTDHYLGHSLKEIPLDTYTVTEVLRLHILGAGGRNNGLAYYGRWRHNCRGMFTDNDDPCVELRQKDPSLLKMMSISNIYDLPPASKLTILTTLINQVLTFAQFRDIIEESIENAKEAKRNWKIFGMELVKKEKEESALKYKEWIASRIKAKEDKAAQKLADAERARNRLAELALGEQNGVSSGVESGGESQMEGTDNSMLDVPEKKTTEEELMEKEELRRENEEQDFCLYKIFREISCKLNIRPLGWDRLYRKYWSFHSVPGILVEGSQVNIRQLLDNIEEDEEGEGNSLDTASQLARDITENGTRHYPTSSHHSTVPHSVNSDVKGGVLTNGVKEEPAEDNTVEQNFVSLCSTNVPVNEIVKLKLLHAERTAPSSATSYKELCALPGFQTLRHESFPWSQYYGQEAITELISSLNSRGEREKALLESIADDKERILETLQKLPELSSYQGEEGEEEEDTTEEQRKAAEILKKTSSEKLIEANLREEICHLENRIFEANFGGANVRNRIAWRQEIEDFWLDDSVKYKDGDIPEVPEKIVNQRLAALKASNVTALDEDSSSMTSGSSTVVSRRAIIAELAEAILTVEQGLPMKYLQAPLGEYIPRNSSKKKCVDKDLLSRWRESLLACTSLSQLHLHVAVLESSIHWGKSILNTNCRVCKRKSDPEKILLCDECDRGHHIYCLKPKLRSIPSGKWYCNACRPTERKRGTRSRKVEEEDEEEEEEEENENDEENENYEENENDEENEDNEENDEEDELSLPDKLKICSKILNTLREAEDGWPFLYPVDGKALPDYYRIIPTPMDLTTIQRNLKQGKYKTISQFSEDVNQIFLNCKHYNTAKAPVYKAGQRLQKLFNQKKREFNL